MADHSSQDVFAHCRAHVRECDKDMFLATLFSPEEAQPYLFALHAFAAELARIPSLVSEPLLGEIRLQWWVETLAAPDGTLQSHPIADALRQAIREKNLPVAPLQQMVEARRIDLYADGIPDMTALETYLGETSSVLIQLSCVVLDGAASRASGAAAGLAGVAFGLSRLLVSGDCGRFVPAGQDRRTLIAHAGRRLAEARSAITTVPPQLLPAFLPLSLTDLYLAAAEKGRPSVPQWRRQWRLWRAARTESV